MSRPPTLVERILGRILPGRGVGESIIGDLREEYRLDLQRSSIPRARLRYLRNVSSVLFRYMGPWAREPASNSRDTHRDRRTMNGFAYDLRHALRVFTRRPGLTTVVVLSLGLGIGANTAIFSLVNTILLKPLPYPDSQELVELFRVDEAVTGLNPTAKRVSGIWAVPFEVHNDWLREGKVFEAGGGFAGTRVRLRNGDGSTSLLALRMASGAFRALGVTPELGRIFLPEDDQVGATPVAVLGRGIWEANFGADPDILGRPILLDDVAYTVVGVMPETFAFPSDAYRLWISFTDDQKTSPVRNGGYLRVVARLSPGISLAEARQDMARVARMNGERHPEEADHGIGMFPLKEMIIGGGADGLWVLLGAVTLVLLIACTNIAGLFLVRATELRREIGVRRALGAGRDRLVLQQMAESFFLALLGGLSGWALAYGGMEPVLSLMPRDLPRIGEMSVDSGLLFTAMGFALLTGLLTGLLPALRAARTPITLVLQEGGRSLTGSRSRNRTQMGLVVSQIALAFVLLSGAALFIRSMSGLLSVDPGFDVEGLALANVSFPSEAETWEEAQLHFRRLEDEIRSLPGVIDVGGADQMPFSGGWSSPPVTIDGPDGEWDTSLHCPTVTPSYFSTMGIPVLMGRGLSEMDTQNSEPVVVVSQALADRMSPGASPLGYRIRINSPDSIWRTVVGVVGDVRYRLDFDRQIMAYVSADQDPTYLDNWVIRTEGEPMALAKAFREISVGMDPEGTHLYQDLEEVIHGSVAVVSARFSVLLLGSLAALAAFLALFGVYGILSYLVQLNSRAIGIQVALGAEGRQVVRSVLSRGILMAVLGLAIGVPLALVLGRILNSQLFGVEPWDPAALTAAGGLLLLATLMASWFPARRAARTDPVEVLKGD